MLREEEEDMDKRPSNRPSSIPPRGASQDVKKDNGNGKFAKQKKTENYARPRNDQQSTKKASFQKGKPFDKRPRPRKFQHERPRDEVTNEHKAEIGSVFHPGSKKGNFNHLLNFTFAPREGTGHGSWKGRNKWSSRGPKYNKEQFLQANCQFVVKEGKDAFWCDDPDRLTDWDQIEQVKISCHEIPSCPICLYPPTAAKITKCGHIYCWTCILHYLSLDDKAWRKCPICYDAIHGEHLKSVQSVETHNYSAGEEITLQLMKRERGSTYVMPINEWTKADGKLHNIDGGVGTYYSKKLMASTEQVQTIIDNEKGALLLQMQEEEESSLEQSFITAALATLNEREQKLYEGLQVKEEVSSLLQKLGLQDENQEKSDSACSGSNSEGMALWKSKKDVKEYACAFSEEEVELEVDRMENEGSAANDNNATESMERPEDLCFENEKDDGLPVDPETLSPTKTVTMVTEDGATELVSVDVAAEELAMPTETSQNANRHRQSGSAKQAPFYYFYQAVDGQQIFLHSVNARCLVKEYGSLENCPSTISAKIVDLEGVTMTAELRSRLRYLNHLPLTCEFQVAELILKPPVISSQNLQCFEAEIEKRRRMRQRKTREEKKRSKKIEVEENKKMGIYPEVQIKLSSMHHFPDTDHGNTASLQPEPLSPGSSVCASSTGTPYGSPVLNPMAPEFVPGSAETNQSAEDGGVLDGPVSFAKMLQQGKTKPPESWPKMPGSRTKDLSARQSRHLDSEESDNEDRVPVPMYQASFGDAIQTALDNISGQEEKQAQPTGNGKKKKKQKKLLFTTTMARSK